ncbi:MAG: HAD family hydrolase [Methanosarcinales archaeon]|nr:MAG: HAD family hydrolase [Methanosarcinales archaeon]
MADINWHSVSADDVFSLVDSSENGLDKHEVEARIERFGFNEVSFKKPASAFYQFFKQFLSPLIYVLLAAAAAMFFLSEWADMAVILGVVLANAVIGFVQERKAQHALESLARMLASEAAVLRDGKRVVVSSKKVVVGDVVLLEGGCRVPADIRLFYVKNLQVDESALTGESLSIRKTSDIVVGEDIPLADRLNTVFAGTFVTHGQGRGVVVSIADNTEIGRISGFIEQSSDFSTPLVRKLNVFGKQLSLAIMFIAFFTFMWGLWFNYDIEFIFLAAVSLAVAAIPESLPAIVTINLAIGVKKMAERNAIIRNLPSVETLGSTTVICTDKTGTLTKNQMTVTVIDTISRRYTLTGAGYEPVGEFLYNGQGVDPLSDDNLIRTLEAGAWCNDAALSENGSGIEGDPTEGALLVAALKAGVASDLQRLDVIPFEPENQYMATLHKLDEQNNIIYVKGSPEKVLSFCTTQEGKTSLDLKEAENAARSMASEALRVLAVGYKKVDASKTQITPEDINKLVFLGLYGMMDPPRDEVVHAIGMCTNAGIRVIMVTGDHRETALAIAKKVGIKTGGVSTGAEIDDMESEDLACCLDETSVFARTSPEHKFKIVQNLQQKGEIVAVTGDGINDAPALKTADIGIAMGMSGTEVSRESSDMVLVDDNFASIVAAVEEGRNVYSKIQKIILWTLPTNGGEGLIIMTALLFGFTFPLLPLHIIWINTVTAIGLGTTLIAEPKEEGLLRRPPRPATEPLLTSLIKKLILIVAILMVTGSFTLFFFNLNNNEDITVARTIVLNTIVMFEVFYLLNCKSINKHVHKQIFSNKFMLIGITIVMLLQMGITYLPAMNSIFHTAPLTSAHWVMIVAISSTVFFLMEFLKYLRSKKTVLSEHEQSERS